ncbi:MAG: FapA family protein [Desulfuromonas sp.]|nr:FapA family protein [Desulfuromonas sp.]
MALTPKAEKKSHSASKQPSAAVSFEEKTADYNIQVIIATDEMSAAVNLTPLKGKKSSISIENISAALMRAGIIEGIDPLALETLQRGARSGKEQQNVVVATTTAPTPGADGWIEPLIKTQDSDHEYTEDESGRVDLYTLNLFTCVKAEQKIAVLHPPQLGEASTTVTGKVLAPLMGKELAIRLGSGVRVEENGTSFISEIAGRADLSDNVLSVSEDYIVHGDVDLEVGNISFPGYTNIRGDVLDHFDIYAQKGITVAGAVGSCHLTTDGDVTIGSMSGLDDGLIRCAGNLKANYLNGITVECMGSVTVANEIRNCTIKSADVIMVKNGVISGGECVALNGIEAKDIGAEAGVITKLCSGVYFPEVDRLQKLKNQQKNIAIQNQVIKHILGPLANKAQRDTSITGALKKRLEILEERIDILKVLQKEVNQELDTFVFEEHDSNAKINVHNRLKERVIISLQNITEEIRFEQQGPLSVVADVSNDKLYFAGLSPLSVKAEDVEIPDPEEDETPEDEEQSTD